MDNVTTGKFLWQVIQPFKNIRLDTTYIPTGLETPWTIYRDTANNTASLVLPNGVILQLGSELFADWQNNTGAELLNGTPVMYGSAIGNSWNQRIVKAIANGSINCKYMLWLITESIDNAGVWKITTHGKVRWLDTTGAPYGETWLDWDIIYVSPTTAGYLTKVKPTAPNCTIMIGKVINAHATVGTIDVSIDVDDNLLLTTLLDTKQLTGFIDNRNITVTGNSTDRKVTLTHGTNIVYYWRWVKYSLWTSWTSPTAHGTDTAKIYYLYTTDWVNFVWSDTMRTFADIQVSQAFYDTTLSKWIYTREIHGTYDIESHLIDHNNIWTFRTSGWTPTTWTYQLNSSVDADITPWFDAALVYDEDLPSDINAWTQGTYTLMNVNNAGATVINTTKTFPFYNTAAGYINYFVNWVETEWATNKFYNVYQILFPVANDTDSQKYRMLLLQPQAEYTSLWAAQAESFNWLALGSFAGIAPEFVAYTRMTFGTNASYGTTGKVQLNGLSYVVGSRASQVSVSSPDKVSKFWDTMTGDLNIWLPDGTGGDNLRTYATLWPELFTNFNAASWTLTSGWEATNDWGTQLNKNAAGVTTATLLGVAPEIWKIYKVVIGMNAMSVGTGCTFTWWWGVWTLVNWTSIFSSYIYAGTTWWLIFTPTPTTTRFTINSISIKEVINGSGSMYCENDLYLGWEILKPDGTQLIRADNFWNITFSKWLTCAWLWSSWGVAAGWAITWATTIASSGANTNTQTNQQSADINDWFITTNTTASTAIIPVQNAVNERKSWTVRDSASRTTNRRQWLLNWSDTVAQSRYKISYDFNGGWYNELFNILDTWEVGILGNIRWTENFTNWALTSWTSWSVTWDMALTSNVATYTHASWVGTLTQSAANLAVKLKPNRRYVIDLTISWSGWSWNTAWIDTTVATKKIHIWLTNATRRIFFKTASTVTAATDFKISATSTVAWGRTIDNLSLKEVSGWKLFTDNIDSQWANTLWPINFWIDSQASDTYVITLNPAPIAYTTWMVIYFKANTANTWAATINVNGLWAKTIVKAVSTTLANNDILAGMFCHCIYDGTNFVLINPRTL